MTQDDLDFVLKCLDRGVIRSPCLEVGVWQNHNTKQLLEQHDIEYLGADLSAGPGVDFQLDIAQPLNMCARFFPDAPSKLFLALNLLEHTFIRSRSWTISWVYSVPEETAL